MAKRRKKTSDEPALVRQDGALFVNFVNTASARRKSIRTYADLVIWGLGSGVLDAADAQRLERTAGERPADAEAVAERAVELRDRLERICTALIAHRRFAAVDLDALNDAYGEALANRRIVPAETGYGFGWGDHGGDDLDRMLWAVVVSAAEILTSERRRRLGRCAGEGCDLFFTDRTGGVARRWCTMKSCGQRVKALRHYHRKAQSPRPPV